ncbi:MAG: hypothetical protein ACOYO1_19290, partial [Bacteroidales bacterium]
KGIQTDSTQLWIHSKLALALLFQGKFDEAKKKYLVLKDKELSYENSKTYKDVFIRDFEDLEKLGITHPDVRKIKELLNQ